MGDEIEITFKKIKNYLRKQISNNNENNIRNKLLCLIYSSKNYIPIANHITIEEYDKIIKDFPPYFNEVDSNTVINIFNNQVSPKKPIQLFYNFNEYNIMDDTYLTISTKTFRPVYNKNWKHKTAEINGIIYEKQISFYADYLRYFLRFKKFANYNEFLEYIFIKYKQPVHKDFDNVYKIINKSYEPIITYIVANELSFKDVKRLIVKSANVINRIQMEKDD